MKAQNISPQTSTPTHRAAMKADDQKYCMRWACGVMPCGQPNRGRSAKEQPLSNRDATASIPAMKSRRTARDRVTCALPSRLTSLPDGVRKTDRPATHCPRQREICLLYTSPSPRDGLL